MSPRPSGRVRCTYILLLVTDERCCHAVKPLRSCNMPCCDFIVLGHWVHVVSVFYMRGEILFVFTTLTYRTFRYLTRM